MTWLTVTGHLWHKWPRICSTCRKHFPVLFSFMTYHRACNESNTTSVTSGAWTAYPSENLSPPPGFSGVRVIRFLVLYVMFWRSLFVLLLLAIVLSVLLRITTSDYPFGIFKPLIRNLQKQGTHFVPFLGWGVSLMRPIKPPDVPFSTTSYLTTDRNYYYRGTKIYTSIHRR